jgi:acyl-CoA synthetase (AMP-forming)/AMP-acid ligase II
MRLYEWLTGIVAERGSEKALVYRDTYLSWRGLLHRVDRRAQELRSAGVGPGSWVGLMLGNVPDFVILALSLSKLEAVGVPLDPTIGSKDLEMVLDAAPLRALITRPRGGEVGQGPSSGGGPSTGNHAAGHAAAAGTGTTRAGSGPIRAPTITSKHVPESRRRLQGTLLTCSVYRRSTQPSYPGADVALVQFTATIGGDPHGIVRTDANLDGLAKVLTDTLDLQSTDRILCAIPLHQSYGFDLGLVSALCSGATLYLEDEVSAKRIAKLLRDHAIDFFPGSPSLFGALMKIPTVKPLRVPNARYLSSGSSLPQAIADGFHERFGIRPLSVYHTTQAGPLAIDRAGRDPGGVGKAFSGVELRIAAGDGTKLAPGAIGPIWVRSPASSKLAVPDIRLSTRGGEIAIGGHDAEDWFRTGDLGQLDRSGRLSITGREDDLVKIDGRRIALGEVEGCLESYPRVKAAKARVIIDDLGGPMVVAQVVREGNCQAEDIIDHCARNLAPYKVPRQIEFCETV